MDKSVIKIIVVDDDDGCRGLIREHLKPVKARFPQTWIVEFNNREEALEEIKKNDVGLIITDMNLHDQYGPDGGKALMEAVSEGLQKEYPFLLITGCDQSDPALYEARKNTGCEVWHKSEPWETFTAKVIHILSETRLETRVKCLEERVEKIMKVSDETQVDVREMKQKQEEFIESDDRLIARFLVGLVVPEWAMKRVRASIGKKKREAIKNGIQSI